ncbi:MAG: hypothetical protein GF421_11095 [Candidatus Aminicenantes bacterium]|nr:hypothetical protein [Candidatus Aminicenantes bacterium]
MKKTTLTAVLLLGLIFLTSSVSASPQMNFQRKRARLGPNPGSLLTVLEAKKDEFEVTDEQMNQIRERTYQMEERTMKFRNAKDTLQLELKREIRDRKIRDYEKIKSLLTKSAQLRTDMIVDQMKFRENINNILSDEQLTKLKDMFKNNLMRRRLLNRRAPARRNLHRERTPVRR